MSPEANPAPDASPDSAQNAFPHTWQAKLLTRAPLIAPARQFTYPQQVTGEEETLSRGAFFLEVRPEAGGTFLATCALGFTDPSLPSGLWSCPAPDDLLAVAGGYGYRVDTRNPTRCDFLPMRPITAVLTAPNDALVLLAGFHDILAVGPEGVRWRSARLSWEGVTLGQIHNGELQGQGWDMFTDREVPFTLNLQTGQHKGGGYNR